MIWLFVGHGSSQQAWSRQARPSGNGVHEGMTLRGLRIIWPTFVQGVEDNNGKTLYIPFVPWVSLSIPCPSGKPEKYLIWTWHVYCQISMDKSKISEIHPRTYCTITTLGSQFPKFHVTEMADKFSFEFWWFLNTFFFSGCDAWLNLRS